MNRSGGLVICLISLILFAAACTPAAASVPQGTPTTAILTDTAETLSTPVVEIQPSLIPERPTDTRPAPTIPAKETLAAPATNLTPSTTLPSSPAANTTPCASGNCVYSKSYILERPILKPGNAVVDSTYRFGSTQGGMREPHHGVEMLNGFGTPVVAAADGTVVVAGDDTNPTSPQGAWPITFYGPYSYFYGNLVVIEHHIPAGLLADLPEMPQPIYTLYAHLSQVDVQPGEQVKGGQQIGAVGLSGIAEGSHLHFEVRLGENTYESVRNPELWLAPRKDEQGRRMGGIAGRVVDAEQNPVVISDVIVLQRLPQGPDAPHDLEIYLRSYEEPALIGQPPYYESFGVGDLSPGLYRITFARQGVQQFLLEVLPGQLTSATLVVE